MTRVICVEQKQRKLTMDKKENSNLELEVVAVLRSVVQSAKGGVLVKNLHSEYALLVGEKVPFKALGYSSLEEMLRSMPDIVKISRNSHGECIVNAVADESTAHIASLISRQKNPKTNPKRVPRRRPMTMSRYSKPQASQYSPRMNAKKQPSTNFSSRAPRDMQNVTLSKTTSDGQPSIPQKTSFNRRRPTTQHPNIPPRFLAHSFTSQSFGQASTAPANFLLKQPLPSSPPPLSPPATPPPLQPFSSPLPSRTSASLLTSSVSLPPLLISSVSPPPLITSVSPPPLITSVSPSPLTSVSPPPLYCASSSILDLVERDISYLSYHDLVSCRDIIDLYAADKGLKVTYCSLPLNPKVVPRTYLSTLTIAKQKFNSYPKDMPTIELAEEEAARVAVESLNILADPESQSLPTSSVDTMEHKKIILKRISKIIQDYTNGLWSMKVESVYKETYNEVLPSDWLDVISSDIKITQVAHRGSILYPSRKNSLLENNDDDVPARQETSLPDSLPLPDSEYWDVFVSYLTSSVDVCIQLVDHSESFQSLVQKMQTCYENNGMVAKKIEDGNLYAIYNEKYWHRIHVTNIMGDKVECYFVDYGDSCITDSNCLYELLPEFSTLPFQALHCQLDGLVEYAENKIMLHHLTDKNLLLGKTLVAKVINKDDPISLVFYDTTTDENININEYLVKITEKDYITPKLPKVGGITKAYLSHVDRNGDVYMRVSGSALDLLKNLMDEFSNQINMEAVKSMSNDKMYCINYIGNWYRAIVKVFPVGDAYKEVEMLCVDYGNCVTVPITNIYELGQLSDELTGLPFQALKCHLHSISPAENEEWSKQTIQQLLKLAPENQVLLLKVITAATENIATSVELFKRIEPNDELVSINETIAMSNYSVISIKENSTESNNILRNNKMDGHCFKPSDLRLNFEEAVSPLTSTNNSGHVTPSQEENKLSKHYSVITPDGFGEQVDDVFELPSLVQTTIPEIGDYFDVHVINAAHPFNFTCQPYKEGSKLEELSKEMQLFYSSEDNTIDVEKCLLRVGQFYAGKNEKNEWCRVCVKNIFEDDDMVSTYFIDYGGYAVVGLSDLQPLWKYFRTLPFQAIRSRLYGIEPVHSDWGINDCVEFKKLVEKREFVSVIKEKKLDKTSNAVQELSLTLIDTSGEDDVYINQLLISKKIAVQTTKR